MSNAHEKRRRDNDVCEDEFARCKQSKRDEGTSDSDETYDPDNDSDETSSDTESESESEGSDSQ